MIIAEKFYAQEQLKRWNETRKLQLCQFIDGRTGGGTQAARREAARVTVAARREGDSNRWRRLSGGREGDGLPRLGLRRLRGRDELVGRN